MVRMDFLSPLTSKNAFGFEISASEISGSYLLVFYLRKRRVPYRTYGKQDQNFKPEGRFRSERAQKIQPLAGDGLAGGRRAAPASRKAR
jgi:hypothetical protein